MDPDGRRWFRKRGEYQWRDPNEDGTYTPPEGEGWEQCDPSRTYQTIQGDSVVELGENPDGTARREVVGTIGLISNTPELVGWLAAVGPLKDSARWMQGAAESLFSRFTKQTATQLTKNSVIEGYRVGIHAWRKSGMGRGATEEMVRDVIQGAKRAGTITTETGTGRYAADVIKVFEHQGVKVVVDDTRKLIMSVRKDGGFHF